MSPIHPLDPLTREEIGAAAPAAKAHLLAQGVAQADLRFESVELQEPSEEVKRAIIRGDQAELLSAAPRVLVVQCYNVAEPAGVWRCLVTLQDTAVVQEVKAEYIPGVQPMIQLEEFGQIETAVKEDPRYIAALAKRGVTDMSMVCVGQWSCGSWHEKGEEGRHISHTFSWTRMGDDHDNYYAHPIEGVNAVVDIRTLEVLRVDDYCADDPVPVPKTQINYEPRFQSGIRKDLRPIAITQPEGVSFSLEGYHLQWHEWSLRVGFNAREGLTLHDIRYSGRPILYRASIAEMCVPYGSNHPAHARKNVFDIGEYGLGKLANSLQLGCDCVGEIRYLDAYLADINGEVTLRKNVICIHEEDAGMLWKHWDYRTDHTEVRRARKLVVSSISTVGNYEYGSYWYFHLDGTIQFEMKATGIINTVACAPGCGDAFGVEVAPGVVGQIHQHIFCARLDLAVDGPLNSVVECNTVQEPAASNPYSNAFRVEQQVLQVETGRSAEAAAQRYWKFVSTEGRNHVGAPTGYELHPESAVTNFLAPRGPSGARANFLQRQLWVTPFHPAERFPAGDFLNGSSGADGVGRYIEAGRSVVDEDLVAWHVFGLHHQPRPEDFPVQSCIMTGFKLMPSGFFSQNPCLDIPASAPAKACSNGTHA